MELNSLMPVDGLHRNVPVISGKMPADAARKAAQQFEAVMLSQSFSEMFKGVEGPASAGGGQADKVWESFMIDEISKSVAETRSIGIAEKVYKELSK